MPRKKADEPVESIDDIIESVAESPKAVKDTTGWKVRAQIEGAVSSVSELFSETGSSAVQMTDDVDTTIRLIYNQNCNANIDPLSVNVLPGFYEMNGVHFYNLQPSIKMTKNSEDLKLLETRNCFLKTIEQAQTSYTKHLFAVLTVMNNNMIVCIINRRGEPIFCCHTLRCLWASSDKSVVLDTLKLCYEFAKTQMEKYCGENASVVTKDLLTSALIAVLKESRIECSPSSINEIISRMKKSISSFLEQSYGSNNEKPMITQFLLKNQSNAYRREISRLVGARERYSREGYERGLAVGMRLFGEISKVGYSFNPDRNVWEKKLNLVPEFCYRDGKLWKFRPGAHNYKLTKLSVDPKDFSAISNSFHIRADGKHPNVGGGGSVCLGELGNKWHQIYKSRGDENIGEQVRDFLLSIEETLEIPNFDSAYESLSNFSDKVEAATRDHTEKSNKKGTGRKWTEIS